MNNGSSLVGRDLNIFTKSSVDNLLDLTNPTMRNELGVSLDDLTWTGSNKARNYEVTQPLGRYAQLMGYNGIIVPSA